MKNEESVPTHANVSLALIGKDEVSRRLCVCERTLENLVRRGEFPAPLRIGKCARWSGVAVDRWLSQKLEAQLNWEPRQRRAKSRRGDGEAR